MKSNVLINNTNSKMYIVFKDFVSGDTLIRGTIEELNRENNNAYKRAKERTLLDFYIDLQSITIWC